jgi:uncharacterized membrane protein
MIFFHKFIEKWKLNNSETALRSLVKAYSYRVCGSLTTILISFIITGQIIVSLAIGATELFIKPFIYWCHERVWSRIRWGKL